MTIAEVYQRYQIMPSLQLHMLRVSGVAQIIVDHCRQDVDRDEVILACLLHDMGNISKFDLLRFPEFLEPEGLEYWQQVKDEFVKTYGSNSHHAAIAIADELGVSVRVKELIDAISFNRERQNYESDDYSRKICAYADMRVAPEGVTSLEARLDDARVRYSEPGKKDTFHYVMRAYLRKIELQLSEVCDIDVERIIEQDVQQLFDELRRRVI